MRLTTILRCAPLAVAACHVGPSTTNFTPARAPQGITAHLRLDRSRVLGELLEVQDTALIVLRQDRVLFVPLATIESGDFDGLGELIFGGRFLSTAARHDLRLVSRFPQGLVPALRAALLAAHGQEELDVVGP